MMIRIELPAPFKDHAAGAYDDSGFAQLGFIRPDFDGGSAWTFLPERFADSQQVGPSGRLSWADVVPEIDAIELGVCGDLVAAEFLNLGLDRNLECIVFDDPLYRGKRRTLPDGYRLRPSKGRFYLLTRQRWDIANILDMDSWCSLWTMGGGVLLDLPRFPKGFTINAVRDSRPVAFMCSCFDAEHTMVWSEMYSQIL